MSKIQTTTLTKKQKDNSTTPSRQVAKLSRCPHCKGKFWSPGGRIMCPWCGKCMIVTDGVTGSMAGFYSKQLEGIVLQGGISGIMIRWSNETLKKPLPGCETYNKK